MLSRNLLCTLLSLMLYSTGLLASPHNLVTNGDFEQPVLTAPNELWRDINAGGSIGKWNVFEGVVSVHTNRVVNLGMLGAKGLQHIDIGHGSGIRQTITGLSPGKSYTLRFDYALHDMAEASSSLGVTLASLDTRLTITNKATDRWKTAEYPFTASSSQAVLELFEHQASNGCGALIDNVVIYETPFIITRVSGSPRASRHSIEQGADLIINATDGYQGALFEVSQKDYQQCQFDDPLSYGNQAQPFQRSTFFQGNIAGKDGLVLSIRPVWPDQLAQLGGISRFFPGQTYYFVYGDYNPADIRFVPSELCRRSRGRFVLDVKPTGSSCSFPKAPEQPNAIDLSSIPVAMGDALDVKFYRSGGHLVNVTREQYLACQNPGNGIAIGDFQESSNNKLTLLIQNFPIAGFVPYQAGGTFYFIHVEDNTQAGFSSSCQNGAKFSVRVID